MALCDTIIDDLALVRNAKECSDEVLDAVDRLVDADMGDALDVIYAEQNGLQVEYIDKHGCREWAGAVGWKQRGGRRRIKVHF